MVFENTEIFGAARAYNLRFVSPHNYEAPNDAEMAALRAAVAQAGLLKR